MFRAGNPCIIRLAGHKVCLRADDLLHVLVEPAADSAEGSLRGVEPATTYRINDRTANAPSTSP